MVAGARTFSLEETFLPAQILNPPPTRHALLAFLLALAAVLHIGTAGWGGLYDGVEGQFAAAGREMLASGQWLVPTTNGAPLRKMPPLTGWAVAASCRIFGVNATAARLPMAFAMIGLIALTFLIGERLAGYWRGFAAGLILLCSSGAFLLGRTVAPNAIFSLFVSAAVYCAVRAYQHQRFRRLWCAGFCLAGALAGLAKGAGSILYLAAICGLLAILFREARLRFRPLLHWSNFFLFIAIVGPWFIWAHRHSLPFFLWSGAHSTFPRWRLLLFHLVWWFPIVFLVLPGFVFAPRKILRSTETTAADSLPLVWLFVALFVEFVSAEESSAAMASLPAFALLAASAWQRTSRPLRTVGVLCALVAAAGFAAISWFRPGPAGSFGAAASLALQSLVQIAFVALLLSAVMAVIFIKQRGEITLVLVLAAMVPVGWCLIEARARLAPNFSLANVADYLNPRLGRAGEVIYEGSLQSGSSLAFYLDKKFFFVNQKPPAKERGLDGQRRYLDEHYVLEAWDRSEPLYLIIDETRVTYWRKLITERVHIYHQVTSCGARVVLSNQL